MRQLFPDDRVYVKNFSSNNTQQWLPGIIIKKTAPVSFVVELTDEQIFRRHQDHVRLRLDEESGTVCVFPDGPQAMLGACPPAAVPKMVTQGELQVPTEAMEPSHTDMQAPL